MWSQEVGGRMRGGGRWEESGGRSEAGGAVRKGVEGTGVGREVGAGRQQEGCLWNQEVGGSSESAAAGNRRGAYGAMRWAGRIELGEVLRDESGAGAAAAAAARATAGAGAAAGSSAAARMPTHCVHHTTICIM